MSTAEIELKFPVADPEALRSRLPALGFVLKTPRTLERNTLYDTPERTMRDQRQTLRIRNYGGVWTLTYKRPPARESELDMRFKLRYETETVVSDGEALGEVFENLGYRPSFRYEKYREEWQDDTGHLVIDETAIGTWAEAEGDPAWIDRVLAALGVDIGTSTTESYGRLFDAWKERTGSPAEHLTFAEIVLEPAVP